VIYTVTFSPSLDYVVKVTNFQTGIINRTQEEFIYPGGKGINVSIVLSNLGVPTKALGFLAGFTGDLLQQLLCDTGSESDFIRLESGFTRINVKVFGNKETAINGQGPLIAPKHINILFEKISKLGEGDILVLSGSIPFTLSNTIYEKILGLIKGKSIKTVVDATGDLVLKALKYHPFLIKPNTIELGGFFGLENVEAEKDIIKYAKQLQKMGAHNILVSRAEKGAILLDEQGKVHCCSAPQGKVVNSVGAGDSMLAGFLAAYEANTDYDYALRLGVSAGSASAFKEWLPNKEDVEKIYNRL